MSQPTAPEQAIELKTGHRAVIFAKPFGESFATAMERLKKGDRVQTFEAGSTAIASRMASQLDSCLLVLHVGSPTQIASHLQTLRVLQRQIKRKSIRIVLCSTLPEDDLGEFTDLGCSEYIHEPVNEKTL